MASMSGTKRVELCIGHTMIQMAGMRVVGWKRLVERINERKYSCSGRNERPGLPSLVGRFG